MDLPLTILRPLLRSRTVWKLSGLTYASAVAATRGRFASAQDYLGESEQQMEPLIPYLRGARVLEFGCGLGGNLTSMTNLINAGLGVDVNAGYIRIARKIADKCGAGNVAFKVYNGKSLFPLGSFDFVFSVGVFERLPKPLVESYVTDLTGSVLSSGHLGLYFLMQRALGTTFTRWLGDSAYTFWTEPEVVRLLHSCGLQPTEKIDWGHFADFWICQRQDGRGRSET